MLRKEGIGQSLHDSFFCLVHPGIKTVSYSAQVVYRSLLQITTLELGLGRHCYLFDDVLNVGLR